ncbi:hypothetical protein T492DRAFT_981392 [Pavlovales sp. CCMP2436]|nr:hypothetical protein T492DRAFT_981392 [Pavlovales sp. CCMP2436]|mmetsp:Transcript_1807/g.4642  ORF Transcript_1807/g.4642 Transcript_1807/m.4642 type:complete len:331 (+) Transcript_1807:119-1111(+)
MPTPRSARAELPQHYGFKPGTAMIQSFSSTQPRELGVAQPQDTREFLGADRPAPARPTSSAGQFSRAIRFQQREAETSPGPNAYYPPNLNHNSGAPFPPRSFQRPPSRFAFNSSQARVMDVGVSRQQTPGMQYTPYAVASSTVTSIASERALAAHRAGGRARWADTAPSAPFASSEPRIGAWVVNDAGDPGAIGRAGEWPPSVDEQKMPFSSGESRFRPTSEGGARILRGREPDRHNIGPGAYSPQRTYRATSFEGASERPRASSSSSSFRGQMPRFRTSVPVANAMDLGHAYVEELAKAPMPSGSRAQRFPPQPHFARFEQRWRAAAIG